MAVKEMECEVLDWTGLDWTELP